MTEQRLEKIEKRLGAVELMLKELLGLARLNAKWRTEEDKAEAERRAEAIRDHFNDPKRWLGWEYETEASNDERAEATEEKGEMEGKRVPQKGRVVKCDRSKGAPDY